MPIVKLETSRTSERELRAHWEIFMPRIADAVRMKRFQVRKGAEVQLIIETELGDRATFQVVNTSINGLGATLSTSDAAKLAIEFGQIIPESKLVWGDNEIGLGRLVLRSRKEFSDVVRYGFSVIDTRVPLSGALSAQFEPQEGSDSSIFDFELSSKVFTLANFVEGDQSHPDVLYKCHQYAVFSESARSNPLYQFYPVRHTVSGMRTRMTMSQAPNQREYVNFGNYDYFGFSGNPEVCEAAKAAISRYGLGSSAAPPLSGRTILHEELEQRLSNMLRKEATILVPSAYSANVSALLGSSDLAVADIYCHASIHDGLSGSRSRVRYFRHNNMKHLAELLENNRSPEAGCLAVTEGLFSMAGDIPNLREFVRVAKLNHARIFIDEVHSFGMLGPNGLGSAEREGVLSDIDIYVGGLSKGIGGIGGFITGSKELVQWLRGFGRAAVFSTALPPCIIAGALQGIKLLEENPTIRKRLFDNITAFRAGLVEIGYAPTSDPQSPIVPVIVGDRNKLGRMNEVIREHGIFVNTVVYPAVPDNECRFRFSLSASHTPSDLQLALIAMKRAFEIAELDPARAREAA